MGLACLMPHFWKNLKISLLWTCEVLHYLYSFLSLVWIWMTVFLRSFEPCKRLWCSKAIWNLCFLACTLAMLQETVLNLSLKGKIGKWIGQLKKWWNLVTAKVWFKFTKYHVVFHNKPYSLNLLWHLHKCRGWNFISAKEVMFSMAFFCHQDNWKLLA